MPLLSVCAIFAVALPLLAEDEVRRRFDIQAGPLAEALMVFGAQSGAIVSASTDLTAGKTSRLVSGELTVPDALTRLLGGTGLRYVTGAEGSFVIVREVARRT